MARAHKIYFTWKNNNKKENQQEWQLQGKFLMRQIHYLFYYYRVFWDWEIKIKTNQNTNKATFVCISPPCTSPHKANFEKNYDITSVLSDLLLIRWSEYWSEINGDSGLSYHICNHQTPLVYIMVVEYQTTSTSQADP